MSEMKSKRIQKISLTSYIVLV